MQELLHVAIFCGEFCLHFCHSTTLKLLLGGGGGGGAYETIQVIGAVRIST